MTLLTAACGWVMLALACALAGWSPQGLIAPASSLIFWIICLACWRAAARTRGQQMIASAVASAYTVGGALLWYLRIDLGSGESGPDMRFGPLAGLLHDPSHPRIAECVGLVAVSLAALGIANSCHRAKADRNSPPTTAYPPDIHGPTTGNQRFH